MFNQSHPTLHGDPVPVFSLSHPEPSHGEKELHGSGGAQAHPSPAPSCVAKLRPWQCQVPGSLPSLSHVSWAAPGRALGSAARVLRRTQSLGFLLEAAPSTKQPPRMGLALADLLLTLSHGETAKARAGDAEIDTSTNPAWGEHRLQLREDFNSLWRAIHSPCLLIPFAAVLLLGMQMKCLNPSKSHHSYH